MYCSILEIQQLNVKSFASSEQLFWPYHLMTLYTGSQFEVLPDATWLLRLLNRAMYWSHQRHMNPVKTILTGQSWNNHHYAHSYLFKVSNWPEPTIEKRRVHNTSTNGEGQSQLPNRLKQLSHSGNLFTMRDYKTLFNTRNIGTTRTIWVFVTALGKSA